MPRGRGSIQRDRHGEGDAEEMNQPQRCGIGDEQATKMKSEGVWRGLLVPM